MNVFQSAESDHKRLQCCVMRKIVLGLGISLDGYIARPNGEVDFLFTPKDYSMAPFFATIDTYVLGRKTLDAALKMGGSISSFGGMATYVFSRSKPAGERDGLMFVSESPAALVRRLRKRKGKNKDIWLMGGGELAREFLKADLVDELYLGVVPVLLGEGIPLFPSGFPQRNFELIENKTYSKGMISLKYKRVRSKAKSKSKTESKSKRSS
jgi:dihydrofolate reductase